MVSGIGWKLGLRHPLHAVVGVVAGVRGIALSVSARGIAAIGIGKTGQQPGTEVIGSAHALVERVARLGRISPGIVRIIAVRGCASQRIDRLIDLTVSYQFVWLTTGFVLVFNHLLTVVKFPRTGPGALPCCVVMFAAVRYCDSS